VKNKARRAGVSVVGISFENNFHFVKIMIDGLRGCWNGRLRAFWRKSFLLERGAGKIKNRKALTIFGTVIWSLPRWHHCQAELISSESLKTSVTRMKQALQPRVRSETAF
jgi:hypothetical protein